jgi:phospholipid transport system substrate-binding protein
MSSVKRHACQHLIALILSCLPLGSAWAGTAQGKDAAVLIERTINEAVSAVHLEREAIKQDPRAAYRLIERTLSPHVDFEVVARLVLGREWRSASPQQRQRFTTAFRETLLRTFAIALSEHVDLIASRFQEDRQLLTVKPLPIAVEGKRVVVRSELATDAKPVAIDYRLHASDDGWKVYDVMIENISFITNYRTEYGALVRREGLERVIEQLEEKNAGNR